MLHKVDIKLPSKCIKVVEGYLTKSDYCIQDSSVFVSTKWRFKENQYVNKGSDFALLSIFNQEQPNERVLICEQNLIAENDGELKQIALKGSFMKNFSELKDIVFGTQNACSHDEMFHSMCIYCNKTIDTNNVQLMNAADVYKVSVQPQKYANMNATKGQAAEGKSSKESNENLESSMLKVIHNEPGFQISKSKAKKLHLEEKRSMLLEEERLYLILDLDHTLIHASPSLPRHIVSSIQASIGNKLDMKKQEELFHSILLEKYQIFSFKMNNVYHYVKKRPFLDEFLQECFEKFQMHIYTHGTRPYANEIMKLIDPEKKYFSDRVLSRTECENMSKKTLKHQFPVDDSMVLILDDTDHVWNENQDNLIHLIPYRYKLFSSFKDINNSAGTTSAISDDKKNGKQPNFQRFTATDQDDALNLTRNLLRRIHNDFFYDFNKRDDNQREQLKHSHVGVYLEDQKSRVLCDCTIVFSGVIPKHVEYSQDPLWKYAIMYGATCTEDITDETTHVVCANRLTEKTIQCEKIPGTFIVHKDWLIDSTRRYRRANELNYIISTENKKFVVDEEYYKLDSKILRKLQEEYVECMEDIKRESMKLNAEMSLEKIKRDIEIGASTTKVSDDYFDEDEEFMKELEDDDEDMEADQVLSVQKEINIEEDEHSDNKFDSSEDDDNKSDFSFDSDEFEKMLESQLEDEQQDEDNY